MSRPSIDQQITFYYTDDLAQTAYFYGTALGLPLALDQGDCRVYRVLPNCYLGFCLRAPVGEATAVLWTLVTDDVDAWHERLTGLGVACDGQPRFNAQYGLYHFFCHDPNGYRIEIQRFENPAWDASNPSAV